MVPYVLNVLCDKPLAISLAQRGNYPGLAPLFQQQFQEFIQCGQYQKAAICASTSPQGLYHFSIKTLNCSGCLRTLEAINLFQALPATQNSSPLRDYYTILLDNGKLNECETKDLLQPAVSQGRKDIFCRSAPKKYLF
jgi:clathrin heavy chain